MMPAVGYAFSQVTFFGFYFIFFDATVAAVAVFAAAALLNAASLRVAGLHVIGGRLEIAKDRRKAVLRTIAGGMVILLMAGWPYFLSGWGSYWHSGNEDAFDAINGRDAYVHQKVALQEYWESVRQGNLGGTPIDGAKLVSQSMAPESLVAVYAVDLGRLQYSSTAFWSVVLNAKQGMDAWLIQALLNLLLMGYGLILLLRKALPVEGCQAVVLATVGVANNFYLSTYFNGHQGSLMFMAIIPFGLCLLLDWRGNGSRLAGHIRSGILLMVLLLFVLGAYPYPLPFFVLAIFIYWLLRRYGNDLLQRRYLWGGVLFFLLLAFYIGTWFLFEPIRDRAAMQFRSWGTVFNVVGFFQFWGIWPSMLASSSSEFMNWLTNSWAVMLASYFVGIGLCGLALYGLYRAASLKQLLFVAFAIMWLALFPFMRFTVGDSYYFYKFLYINSFFVVALALFGYLQIQSGQHVKALRMAAAGLVWLWVALNLVGNISAAWRISNKPYNAQAAEFQGLAAKLRNDSKEVYIDFPKRGKNGSHLTDNESVARNYLWNAGLQYESEEDKAKYLLRMNVLGDIGAQPTEVVLWRTPLFRLVKAPDSNLLMVRSYWAPEYDRDARMLERSGHYRWVSDGESNWLSVDIARPNAEARFLHFCAESGPSVDYRPIALRVSDGAGSGIGEFEVEYYGCHWVDLAGRQGPFRLSSEAVGHIFSLIDTRHLNFRVFNVGISNTKYDLSTLRYLNDLNDITPSQTAESLRSQRRLKGGAVYLLNGWHDLERQAGEKFRWAQTGAEVLVDGCVGELALDIAPGPSLGRPDMNLSVRSSSGDVIARLNIKDRAVVKIPVDAETAKGRILELRAESEGVAIPGDSRRLDFRVFGIAWSKTAGGRCGPNQLAYQSSGHNVDKQ